MTDTTTVPTIAETIRDTLTMRGYAQYATLPVVDILAQTLMDRERRLYGDSYQSGQPVTDEILRRLEESPGPVSPVQDESSLGERVTRLENEVANLISFARDNGYRL